MCQSVCPRNTNLIYCVSNTLAPNIQHSFAGQHVVNFSPLLSVLVRIFWFLAHVLEEYSPDFLDNYFYLQNILQKSKYY